MSITNQKKTQIKKRPWSVFSRIVGVLMVVQSAFLFCAAFAFSIFVLLMGGLAFVAGAGNATDAQIEKTWHLIFLIALAPLLWPTILVVGGINLLRLKNFTLVIVCSGLAVAFSTAIWLWFYTGSNLNSPTINFVDTILYVSLTMFVPLAGVIVSAVLKWRSSTSSGVIQ